MSPRSTRLLCLAAGLCAVVGSLLYWIYAHYPQVGHDYGSGVLAAWELRYAWSSFGVFDLDFSPFRCFGLPVFANPNGISWSLFHVSALVAPSALSSIAAVEALIASAAFIGAVRLCRSLRLPWGPSVVLAVGWCLQGWSMARATVGHVGFLSLALLPLWLATLRDRRPRWFESIGVSFWIAHLFFSAGYYIFIISIPSLLLATVVLERLLEREPGQPTLAQISFRLAAVALGGLLLALPKILAVLDFSALYPRLATLEPIGLVAALRYELMNLLDPLPYDIRNSTGWWYGDWESIQFLLPGAAYGLAWLVARSAPDFPRRRVVGMLALLIGLGTLLSSGLLAPLFAALPVLRSLHVNPRWNAVVLLPFFALTLTILRRSGFAAIADRPPSRRLPPALTFLCGAIFVIVPLLFLDPDNLHLSYRDKSAIDRERKVAMLCHEPIFGPGLEAFPIQPAPAPFDPAWLEPRPVDPRCYLASSGCAPGTLLAPDGPRGTPEDRAAHASYSLKDDHEPVRSAKRLVLPLYVLAGLIALAALAVLVRETIREALTNDG